MWRVVKGVGYEDKIITLRTPRWVLVNEKDEIVAHGMTSSNLFKLEKIAEMHNKEIEAIINAK
jgi:hypothetical protein